MATTKYQNDHLSTSHNLTDNQGNTVWRGQYNAYGQLTEEWTPPEARNEHPQPKVNNPLRFQGQYEDAESGLYYNLNRYYDPGVGRYLTAAPVKLVGGLNSYQYVDGNPVGWVDPLGLFKTDVTGAERSSVNTGTPKLPEIPWSNSTVKRASDQLDRGARDVYVNSRADAEELFRGKYVGEGYRNAENFNSVTAKDYFEVNRSNKEPYYHWDDVPVSGISTRKVYMVNHEVNSLHGEIPHLQLHPIGEKAIRIYWPNKMGSKK